MSFHWKAALGTRNVGDKHVITKREKTMRKRWIVTLGMLAMTLAIGGWAEATLCPPGGLVSAGNAVDLNDAASIGASGFNNTACDLIIDVTIPVTDPTLVITAKSITVDPLAGGPVEIINNAAASISDFTAELGNITITEGSIKAHKLLRFTCKAATGEFDAEDSELVAALNFANPQAGGDLLITCGGKVEITGSTVHGGDILEFVSKNQGITLICGPSETGCTDPNLSNQAVALCGTCPPLDTCPPDPLVPPAVFPCDVEFADAAALREVCIPVRGGKCNGGSKEKRFTAKEDIDITGSTLTSIDHVTFTSTAGRLLASGANLTSGDSIVFAIKGDGTSPSIDLSNATITTATHTTITAGSECPLASLVYPANVCINANGALIQASNIIMTADANTGVMDLCGTAVADPLQAPTKPPQPAGATVILDIGTDFPTFNGISTPPWLSPTVLNGTGECAPLFGALIGRSLPPGPIIDP